MRTCYNGNRKVVKFRIMKILFSAGAYPHKGNPFAAFIKVICEELVRQGHEVTVIAPQSLTRVLAKKSSLLPYSIDYEISSGNSKKFIKVIRPYSFTFGYGRFLKYTYKFNKIAFNRICGRYIKDCDIVYAHFWTSGYNAVDVAEKYKKPLFVTTGEDEIYLPEVVSEDSITKLRKYVKGVICVSTKNRDESVSIGLADSTKCIVIPNSINQNEFYFDDKKKCREKLNFPQNSFIVSFCGRFIDRKGVNRVSDAIKLLNDSNVKSIFIGQNVQNQKIQPDCDGILFKGPLPHHRIVDYLNAADVFVLPTLAEGCSNSIVEAMACGLPIISSDLPFNHDILNKENAILVDPMNVEQIGDSIKKLKEDRSLQKKMSAASLRSAKELTIEKRVRRIVAFIEQKIKE